MAERKMGVRGRRTSAANAKQEMLAAYQQANADLEARREAELKPEEKIAEKVEKAAVTAADELTTERIARDIGALKSEIGRTLTQVGDRLDAEVLRYQDLKRAVSAKEKELQEIYEIQNSASTVAALLEVQQQKREEFEAEAGARKAELDAEIETRRAQWQEEKVRHDLEGKELQAADKKARDREREDYEYRFKREQQLAREKFEDEKARSEREQAARKVQIEAVLAEREKAVAAREAELAELRKTAEAAPKERDEAVARAVKEALGRAQQEAKAREELARKEFEGERNVLLARIDALEKAVKDQATQILKFSQQIEKAYGQVQDIAVKSVEGVARAKAQAQAEQLAAEQSRKGESRDRSG
jgi:hypothetical protein